MDSRGKGEALFIGQRNQTGVPSQQQNQGQFEQQNIVMDYNI